MDSIVVGAECWAATMNVCGAVMGCEIVAAFVQAVVYAAECKSWERKRSCTIGSSDAMRVELTRFPQANTQQWAQPK